MNDERKRTIRETDKLATALDAKLAVQEVRWAISRGRKNSVGGGPLSRIAAQSSAAAWVVRVGLIHFASRIEFGGARRDRTVDLNTASVALSQLS